MAMVTLSRFVVVAKYALPSRDEGEAVFVNVGAAANGIGHTPCDEFGANVDSERHVVPELQNRADHIRPDALM
jgi:hypothetical protein